MLRGLLRGFNAMRFASEVQKASDSAGRAGGLTYYRNGELVTRNAITLKKEEDIEAYVVKTVQDYFRTTYKQGTALVS